VRSDEQSVTNSGRLFHARGPSTAKARSPSDERRVDDDFIYIQNHKIETIKKRKKLK